MDNRKISTIFKNGKFAEYAMVDKIMQYLPTPKKDEGTSMWFLRGYKLPGPAWQVMPSTTRAENLESILFNMENEDNHIKYDTMLKNEKNTTEDDIITKINEEFTETSDVKKLWEALEDRTCELLLPLTQAVSKVMQTHGFVDKPELNVQDADGTMDVDEDTGAGPGDGDRDAGQTSAAAAGKKSAAARKKSAMMKTTAVMRTAPTMPKDPFEIVMAPDLPVPDVPNADKLYKQHRTFIGNVSWPFFPFVIMGMAFAGKEKLAFKKDHKQTKKINGFEDDQDAKDFDTRVSKALQYDKAYVHTYSEVVSLNTICGWCATTYLRFRNGANRGTKTRADEDIIDQFGNLASISVAEHRDPETGEKWLSLEDGNNSTCNAGNALSAQNPQPLKFPNKDGDLKFLSDPMEDRLRSKDVIVNYFAGTEKAVSDLTNSKKKGREQTKYCHLAWMFMFTTLLAMGVSKDWWFMMNGGKLLSLQSSISMFVDVVKAMNLGQEFMAEQIFKVAHIIMKYHNQERRPTWMQQDPAGASIEVMLAIILLGVKKGSGSAQEKLDLTIYYMMELLFNLFKGSGYNCTKYCDESMEEMLDEEKQALGHTWLRKFKARIEKAKEVMLILNGLELSIAMKCRIVPVIVEMIRVHGNDFSVNTVHFVHASVASIYAKSDASINSFVSVAVDESFASFVWSKFTQFKFSLRTDVYVRKLADTSAAIYRIANDDKFKANSKTVLDNLKKEKAAGVGSKKTREEGEDEE